MPLRLFSFTVSNCNINIEAQNLTNYQIKLIISTAQKMKISIKDFFSKCDQFPADLVTFTEEIVNGNLRFLCSDLLEKL